MSKNEEILKEFNCCVKIADSLIRYNFKAVNELTFDNYILKVISRKYDNGRIIFFNKSISFFDDENKLITEYNKRYSLLEKNLFTESIEELK